MTVRLALIRFVVTPFALLFAGIGLRFWLSPAATAREFGLEAADAAGLVAVRADLGGLFVGLALLTWAGAWMERLRSWLVAATVVLLAVVAGRLIGGLAAGGEGLGLAQLALELVGSAGLLAAATASPPRVRARPEPRSSPPPGSAPAERTGVFRPLVVALAALALPVAAQAARVRHDADSTVDLSKWRRWAWSRPAPAAPSTIAEGRIRREVEAALVAKGYARVESRREADFLVDLHGAVDRELRIHESTGPRFRRDARVTSVPTGTLVVDLVDCPSGKLAWRGAVSDELARDPGKADRKAEKSISKLFDELPSAAD